MDGFGGNRGAIRFVAALAALGGVLLVLWGVRGLTAVFDDIVNVELPGPEAVVLESGPSTVYYDKDVGVGPTPALLARRLTITAPDGSVIRPEATGFDLSITTPSRDLVAVLDFEAPVDGDYTVEVDEQQGLPPGRLAVGPRFLPATWRSLAGIVAGALAAIGGIVGFAVSLGRRSTGGAPAPAPTPRPAPRGGWGRRTTTGGWGGSGSASDPRSGSGEDEDIWADAHDWSDEFDDAPASLAEGDGWGSGRGEGDATWRWRDRSEAGDDDLPPGPSSF